jgi:hypothetical protein
MLRHLKIQPTVGFVGRGAQGHVRLFRGAVSLLDIAADTCSRHVLPGFAAAARSGNYVIQGEFVAREAAVLAGVTVAVENIAAGEGNFFVGDSDVVAQPDHRGERQLSVEHLAVVLDLFRFSFNQQYNRSPPACNVEGFVRGVQHQNLAHFGCVRVSEFRTDGSTATAGGTDCHPNRHPIRLLIYTKSKVQIF